MSTESRIKFLYLLMLINGLIIGSGFNEISSRLKALEETHEKP